MSKQSSDNTNASPSEIHENPLATLDEQKMLSKALRGDWDSFVQDYEQKPQLRKAALNQSQQTALHIAVTAGESEIAIKLISIAAGKKKDDIEMGASPVLKFSSPRRNSYDGDELDQKDERGDTAVHLAAAMGMRNGELDQKDDRGNTALHLAAAMGMRNVCQSIVNVSDPQLIFNRNKEGETPIFLAATHGWAELFFSFHWKAKATALPANDAVLGRHFWERNDGNTMLHCAIANDKFDLALMVLKLYPNLKTSCNNNGETPLHILATKPTAFRSGTPPLGIIKSRLYSWITVEILEYPFREAYAQKLKDDRYYGKQLKNMKRKHILAEKIMVELMINVKSWSDFNEERLGIIPFDGERNMAWATPILPISDSSVSDKMVESTKASKNKDSSVSDKMAEESTNTLDNKEISDTKLKKEFGETLFLIAVRMGITEMVEAILKKFPDAISQKRVSDGKNALLLAVENRQINVYDFLIRFMDEKKIPRKDVGKFQDRERNNPLHLAAIRSHYQPWLMEGEAMKMLWEYKWYQHVRVSFPLNFIEARNADGKTPLELFTYTHKDQMKTVEAAREWMNKTSQSCSVVASLIAAVAFASATTFPEVTIDDEGLPKCNAKCVFDIFAMIPMLTSLSSLVMFLAVFMTPFQDMDAYGFYQGLLKKLLTGIRLLYLSIVISLEVFLLTHYTVLSNLLKASLHKKIAVGFEVYLFVVIMLATSKNIVNPTYTLMVHGRRPRPWYR